MECEWLGVVLFGPAVQCWSVCFRGFDVFGDLITLRRLSFVDKDVTRVV